VGRRVVGVSGLVLWDSLGAIVLHDAKACSADKANSLPHATDGDQAAAAQAAGRKRSKLEELMQRDLEAKKRRQEGPSTSAAAAAAELDAKGAEPSSSSSRGRVDHWLYEGIVVKVVSKALKEHGYYKQKVRGWLGSVILVIGLRGGMPWLTVVVVGAP